MRTKVAVHSDPDILGGTPVFVGTRVPFQTLMDYLEAGHPLADFLKDFPTVARKSWPLWIKPRKPCSRMRVLLDECVPIQVKFDLAGYDVRTVGRMGWAGKRTARSSDWLRRQPVGTPERA